MTRASATTAPSTLPSCGCAAPSKTTPSSRDGYKPPGAWATGSRLENPHEVEQLAAKIPEHAYGAAHAGHHFAGAGRHVRVRVLLPEEVHRRSHRRVHGNNHTHAARRPGRDSLRPARRIRAPGLPE